MSRDVVIKSARELELMRQAGRIVARVLEAMRQHAAPGVTTGELDALAEEIIRDEGATPSFKDYTAGGAHSPYPGTICASVDTELVHGIPSRQRVLREGQILSVDVGGHLQRVSRRRGDHGAYWAGDRPGAGANCGDRGGFGRRHRRRPGRQACGRHLGGHRELRAGLRASL